MKAEQVEGWLMDCEIPWLREQGRKARVMVEIGSWKGKSATALLEESEGVLFCVDPFTGNPGEEDLFHEVHEHGSNAICNQFLANVQEFIEAGRLFLLRMPSGKAFAVLPYVLAHRRPDLVWIDADHREGMAAADILAALELVRPGGLVCGHNMDYAGVRGAVRKYLPGFRRGPGTLWYFEVEKPS